MNVLGRIGVGTLAKGGQGLSFLAGLAFNAITDPFQQAYLATQGESLEGNIITRSLNNAFHQMFESLDEEKQNLMPVFKDPDYDEMGFLGKLFTQDF
jgi:hypothetical protein